MDYYDFAETAAVIEKELGIRMHLDIVFNNQLLNKYFNYSYNKKEDILTINFELDEGSATMNIYELYSEEVDDFDYDFNDVLKKHIENLGRTWTE